MKAVVILLLMVAGSSAQFMWCGVGTDPFVMTAEATQIFNSFNGKKLKFWGSSNTRGRKCIEMVLNTTAKTYKLTSTKRAKGSVPEVTTGTFVWERKSRTNSYITFSQQLGPNTGLMRLAPKQKLNWFVSHINPTDMMLNNCWVAGFWGQYEQHYLTTTDLGSVSSSCFTKTIKRDLGTDMPHIDRPADKCPA